MKAVIVEIKDSIAAVLSDNGRVIKIKNNNYEIGQVIHMKDLKVRITKKVAAFAAAAAAFTFVSLGAWAYASPYAYVSLDVNPSIEFTVNYFDRVLSVDAVNDDGEEVLEEIDLDDLKHKSIDQAVSDTIQQINELGYFENNSDDSLEYGIVITTSGKDTEKAEQLAENLQQVAEAEVQDKDNTIIVEVYSVGLERVREARSLGVTPGKLNLVEKLITTSENNEIVLEEWLNKPVKEIMKATKIYRNSSKELGIASGSEESEANQSQSNSDQQEQNENESEATQTSASLNQTEKNAQKAAKETEKQAVASQKQEDKDAQKAAKEAEKQAVVNQKQEDKDAQKAAKENEKQAIVNQKQEDKDSQKAIKDEEKQAEANRKKAELVEKQAKKDASQDAKATKNQTEEQSTKNNSNNGNTKTKGNN